MDVLQRRNPHRSHQIAHAKHTATAAKPRKYTNAFARRNRRFPALSECEIAPATPNAAAISAASPSVSGCGGHDTYKSNVSPSRNTTPAVRNRPPFFPCVVKSRTQTSAISSRPIHRSLSPKIIGPNHTRIPFGPAVTSTLFRHNATTT